MTTATLRTVHLHGHLAEGIGEKIELAFNTPSEAIRLIEANYPGFVQRFKGWFRVVAVRGQRERTLQEHGLDMGFTGDLMLVPVLEGAADGKKKGLIGAILGAVIVGAAFFFSGGTLTAALPGFLGSAGLTFGSIAQFGAGLVLSGVSTLLSPTPQDAGDVDQRKSFVFNGPKNLTQPGGVMQVAYGRCMVGTYTVSTAVQTELITNDDDENPSVGQYAITSEYMIRDRNEIVIDLDELVHAPFGAELTILAGVAVSQDTTATITQAVANSGGGDLSFDVDTTDPVMNNLTNPGKGLITMSFVGGNNPNGLTTQETVWYTVTHDGTDYVGKFYVDFNKFSDSADQNYNHGADR